MALLLAALLAAAGCGRERAAPAPPATLQAPARGAVPEKGAPAGGEDGSTAASDNGLRPTTEAIPFTSREAGFSAVFPAGCPRIRTRVYSGGSGAGAPEVVQCSCDRAGRLGEGVMVATYLALRDERGGPPNPRNVTKLIEDLTRKFQLQVVRQATVTRPDYEGVRVFCRETSGRSALWVQGMLAGDRVFIMTAWCPAGGGLSDGQVASFFESFRPEP
jgi:hypothetical protein